MRNILRVKFFNNDGTKYEVKDYDYFYNGEAKKGDMAVVKVGNVFKIVEVDRVMKTSKYATKYAYTVFSEDGVKASIEKEQRLCELREEMEDRIKQIAYLNNLKKLTEEDDVLKGMFEEYMNLNKQETGA